VRTRKYDLTTLDTRNPRGDEVTVILSHRLPEAIQAPATYRLLVSKGNAR
jgi:hypothetical protein